MSRSSSIECDFEGRHYTSLEFARAFGLPPRLVWLRLYHGIIDARLPINGNINFRPHAPRKKSCPRSAMYVQTSFGEYKV